MIKYRSFLPFFGISLLSIYWILLLNDLSYNRKSLTCFDSQGYQTFRDIFTKKEIYDVIEKCSIVNSDNKNKENIYGPIILIQKKDQQLLNLNSNDFNQTFYKNIAECTSISTYMFVKKTLPKFNATISRNVTVERNGITFKLRQKICLEHISAKFSAYSRVFLPIISTICIFTQRLNKQTLVPFILSLTAVFMHTFFNGRSFRIFRLILAVSWALQFAYMLGLSGRALSLVIPVISLTGGISMFLFAFLFDSSKWFSDLLTSYLVTVSLMVGDHIIDTLKAVQGSGITYVAKYSATCLFILVLVFIVMSSFGKPMNRLILSDYPPKPYLITD